MTAYQANLLVHVVFGTVSLASFWTAAFVRKGSPVHRSAGKVFLLAMCMVLLTGVALVAHRFLNGRWVEGAFLGYLFFITGNACWLAWRAVQDKTDWRRLVARWTWKGWMAASLLTGALGLALGLRIGDPVVTGFSLIGPFIALRMWRFARRGPTRSNWHVIQHYQGILGAGVATHVAFLSIGMQPMWKLVRQMWPAFPAAVVNAFPWFAPLTVALIVGVWLNRKYGRMGRPWLPASEGENVAPRRS